MNEAPKSHRVEIEHDTEANRASLRFFDGDQQIGATMMSLEALTDLIQELGKVRSKLVQGKELPRLEELDIAGIFDTRWFCQPTDKPVPSTALSFQHPAFGPLGFVIPLHQVAQLIGLMMQQVLLGAIHPPQHPIDGPLGG